MFNKPKGCITACSDARHKTVMDYFPESERTGLFPIGRLDKDTEGLLIVTDDGQLSFKIANPESKISKTYVFYATGEATEEKIERLRGGVIIDTKIGEIMASAEAELLGIFKMSDIADTVSDAPARIRGTRSGSVPVCRVKITITEGKKHQVKKMALAVGLRVIYLERIAISSLKLDKDLPRGEFRPLREDELSALGYSI